MKKQFLRVKQYADQTFLKADKSEALNHKELQVADNKVDYLRSSLNNIIKRLPLNQAAESNVEKRMKKFPEYLLGQSFQDQTQRNVDSECKLLQSILKDCAVVELELAKEQAEHELKVEQLVSVPMQLIVDSDLPNILKHKRNLSKYLLDKDSASNRYHSSKNGNNKEALKDCMEEADIKVEQYRDVLAAEMFNLLRRESELSQHILQILKLQRGYHESALKNLEKIIPTLEQKIGDSPFKAVFGSCLEEHLRVSNRRIAFPLELCICALTEIGMSEEGLFRVVGAASRVKRLKLAIDSGCFSLPLIPEYSDVHVLASTLKAYLRDLPEPLLTYHLHNEWLEAMQHPPEKRLAIVQHILQKLPQCNRENLTYLIQFFAKLSRNIENKMNSSNIAIVIAPNLLWSQNIDLDIHMSNFTALNMLVELFVNNASILFPEDVSDFLTISPTEILPEEPEFMRPVLSNVKLTNYDNSDSPMANYQVENSFQDTSSPKPNVRRKTKLAPPVPVNKKEIDFNDCFDIAPSYPSGSTTLNRVHKPKHIQETKSSALGINSSGDNVSNSRRQSLIIDSSTTVLQNDSPGFLMNLSDTENSDIMSDIQTQKTKPIQQISAQCVSLDKVTIITNNLQTKNIGNLHLSDVIKPVAAPRLSLNCDNKPTLDSKSVVSKIDNVSKCIDEINIDGDNVKLRKPFNDNERPVKPVVPSRPASLKAVSRAHATSESTEAIPKKSHCTVYTVNKQQPSYVNIQNKTLSNEKFQLGHDTQMAEKEKFLGHQLNEKSVNVMPTLENKCGDINFNYAAIERTRTSSVGSNNKPEIPPKLGLMKSNEKLEICSSEKINGNAKSSHTRTHSDGNIIEPSLVHTPPSPRTLNKPTEPPPPPPVAINKPRSDLDSTNL